MATGIFVLQAQYQAVNQGLWPKGPPAAVEYLVVAGAGGGGTSYGGGGGAGGFLSDSLSVCGGTP